MIRLLAVAALVVAACSSSAAPDDEPDPTDRPAPTPTAAPWSAAFEARMCMAIDEFPTLQADLDDLTAAALDVDVEGVVAAASAAGDTVRSIDANLKAIASEYRPARPLLVAWRRANRSMIRALDDIEEGAEDLDFDQIDRGSAELIESNELIVATAPLIEAFGAETGFECS